MPLPPAYGAIAQYIQNGLVSERPHPLNPAVRILNYTQKCQYSRSWDDVTRACRGLVLNVETGDVLANPFPKFFNYQEHLQNGWPIPEEQPVITEKLDGSLGILVWTGFEPWIATRGSFESEQAQWATAWWREHMRGSGAGSDGRITHLFEIIAPVSRVVVRYDFEGLVYLGSRITQTGEPIDCWDLFDGTSVRRAAAVEPKDLDTLAAMDVPNSEGFVCHYPTANVRLKIKFADYVRLHRVVTGLSELAIWERLRDGKSLEDVLANVPDEFFQFVKDTEKKLWRAFGEIDNAAVVEFCEVNMWAHRNGLTWEANRGEIAKVVATKKHRSLVFAMLDRKPYAHAIWKAIRPVGATTFSTDTDA